MKFQIKANPNGQYYLPKEVRQELCRKLELICTAQAAVIYPEGLHPQKVQQSLLIILHDLRNRSELQRQEEIHEPY